MFACLQGSGNLTALAFDFSPTVEQTAPDTVTLDASGLDRLFGLPQDVAAAIARRAAESQLKISIALADNPDAAICAARGFHGVSVIPYGDEAKFLGNLPLSLLAPTEELHETLDRWGIRFFQDLAALPPLGIAERLGPEGLRLRELARGEAQRKLLPLEEALRFDDELELEYPVELLEPLAFLLARLLNGLATRLATRGLATNELQLRLDLENKSIHERVLRLPVPSLDTKAFLKLLQLDLSAHPPNAPIVHIWMSVNPVKPQAAQNGLFIPVAPEPVKLELTLARIKSIVGEERVGTPQLLDTHRPGAFLVGQALPPKGDENQSLRHGRLCGAGVSACPSGMRELPGVFIHAQHGPADHRTSLKGTALCAQPSGAGVSACQPIAKLILRIYRPPRSATVSIAQSQPAFIEAQGIRGKVLDLAGPWRTSGDWWTSDPWLIDEWDIALSDGALYRLCCNPRGWFVEGCYD